MDVNIFNSAGKAVMHLNMSAVPGINNGHIHVGDFAPGAYSIVFKLNGNKETYKVVVK